MISKKSLITIGCTAAVAVIALGAVFVFGGNGEDKTPSSSSADVLEPVTEAPTEPELPIIENFSDEPGLTGLAKMLLRENDDVVGYIKISNTYVDYPVVQYDGEDLDEQGNDYYLHRDLWITEIILRQMKASRLTTWCFTVITCLTVQSLPRCIIIGRTNPFMMKIL